MPFTVASDQLKDAYLQKDRIGIGAIRPTEYPVAVKSKILPASPVSQAASCVCPFTVVLHRRHASDVIAPSLL